MLIFLALLDDQVTKDVILNDVPFEYVPVAVNCCVTPTGMERLVAVTAMDTSVAAVTVMVVLLLLPPKLAVMVEEPTLAAVASPVLLMVTALVLEVQVVVA